MNEPAPSWQSTDHVPSGAEHDTELSHVITFSLFQVRTRRPGAHRHTSSAESILLARCPSTPPAHALARPGIAPAHAGAPQRKRTRPALTARFLTLFDQI